MKCYHDLANLLKSWFLMVLTTIFIFLLCYDPWIVLYIFICLVIHIFVLQTLLFHLYSHLGALINGVIIGKLHTSLFNSAVSLMPCVSKSPCVWVFSKVSNIYFWWYRVEVLITVEVLIRRINGLLWIFVTFS